MTNYCYFSWYSQFKENAAVIAIIHAYFALRMLSDCLSRIYEKQQQEKEEQFQCLVISKIAHLQLIEESS